MAQSLESLRGVRVWISAAIPDGADEAQRLSILEFMNGFADTLFKFGGHIIHGSHPSITPTLLRAAERNIERGGKRDCLTLAISRRWSKNREDELRNWRNYCLVYETEEVLGENARDGSLDILRKFMASRCDAFIAAGGRWWSDAPHKAGIPIEASLAFGRVPCFILGGLHGAAKGFLGSVPDVIAKLKNGLDDETNSKIAFESDIGILVETVCNQLSRLPLVRGRVENGLSFRVLALDGGGIKGAYTAAVLASLERSLNCSISDHFDIIAGTSTGGILAIGLGMGMSAAEMLEFYRKRGSAIFPNTSFHQRLKNNVRHAFAPKYSHETLLRELKNALYPKVEVNAGLFDKLVRRKKWGHQVRTFKNSKNRLVIPAYDALSGACHTFRTPHNPNFTSDADIGVADIALATAAAPTYFASAKVRNMISESSYVDGGVWANSPVMAAVIEAVFYLEVSLDRIDILSIGTTHEPFSVISNQESGYLGWGPKKLLNLLMDAQEKSAIEHAKRLVGEARFLRINATTPPGMYTLDGSADVERLISMGNRVSYDPSLLSSVKSRFMNGVPVLPW